MINFPTTVSNSKIDVLYLDSRYPARLGLHPGIDINGVNGGDTDLGMPFRAITDGEVVYAVDTAPTGTWGGLIVVHHPQLGIWSRYGHHNPGSRRVKVGDKVTAGTTLAGIGKGKNNAFAAHLHFDIFTLRPSSWTYWVMSNINDVVRFFVDPIAFFRINKVQIPSIF
ncbi:MAG: M23 family metallopeptidase [Candidatus Diapherotrites archaeon]